MTPLILSKDGKKRVEAENIEKDEISDKGSFPTFHSAGEMIDFFEKGQRIC